MSLTLLDLKNRVYAHLRDGDHNFVQTNEVEGWLNDAYVDLLGRLKTLTAEASGVLASANIVTIPADFVALRYLRIAGDDADVTLVDDDTWNAYVDEGVEPPTRIARAFGPSFDEIILYPDATVGDVYQMIYTAVPSTLMTTDTSEPVGVPLVYQVYLTYYALAQAYMKLDDQPGHDRWWQRYEVDLPARPTGRELEDVGSVTMTFELGPFDTDLEARHL